MFTPYCTDFLTPSSFLLFFTTLTFLLCLIILFLPWHTPSLHHTLLLILPLSHICPFFSHRHSLSVHLFIPPTGTFFALSLILSHLPLLNYSFISILLIFLILYLFLLRLHFLLYFLFFPPFHFSLTSLLPFFSLFFFVTLPTSKLSFLSLHTLLLSYYFSISKNGNQRYFLTSW